MVALDLLHFVHGHVASKGYLALVKDESQLNFKERQLVCIIVCVGVRGEGRERGKEGRWSGEERKRKCLLAENHNGQRGEGWGGSSGDTVRSYLRDSSSPPWSARS